MRVAAIGLGGFAERAYLDHLVGMTDIELHLCTRDPDRLAGLGARYRIERMHRDWRELLDGSFDAALVHAATGAHRPIVESLLRAGVDVYVDKPLDDSHAGAAHLVATAEETGRSLMVGFNRRHAPAYTWLTQSPRLVTVMHKHRAGLPTDIRELVFGDFIHVVDTLRFLAPAPITRHEVDIHSVAGIPQLLTVTLTGAGFTSIGTTQRIATGAIEHVECVGDDGAMRQVIDLDTKVTVRGTEQVVSPRAMWSRTPWQRGSEQIIDAFLAAVSTGTVLSARDALVTHEICEEIVSRATA